ncbi:S-adenosyl-L-methionine-dependent methyltransferase [Naematelia encephala]|uniref:Protein arginine methyltransferase NDUFAF7 n=1 Tax=Naematelia encephala TaxID=71784 RepID=A0A1Y2B4L2_9TREE|nr:S-adenosyl-L-methionine-dependent methyltransferase [Naematelia encephala]
MSAGPSSRTIAQVASTSRRRLVSGSSSRRVRLPVFPALQSVRHASSEPDDSKSKGWVKGRFNFNTSLTMTEEPDPDYVNWRRVTAADLAHRREPPTRVKMLVRDFIDDSLYNPHYGYFSRNATIFTPPTPEGYSFASFRDQGAFTAALSERYLNEYKMEAAQTGEPQSGIGRQVWHTPTELFKPYYARALTSAILNNYKLNHFPYQDLIIYEIGAGNGSFMVDSLAFLRDRHPEVYARTKYRIIEISATLAEGQRNRAVKAGFRDKVEVINEDFSLWTGGSDDPCYVVALEVLDNFSHDMIRYDVSTLEPYQAIVVVDAEGDFTLVYEPVTDPLIQRFLEYRDLLPPSSSTSPYLSSALLGSTLLRRLYSILPLAPNLSDADFIPSKSLQFLEQLRHRLPNHRLLLSDFDSLPDALKGRNGPVVQTRYQGTMIPCETFLVKQGYFDIFFPTDFRLLRDIYGLVMSSNDPDPSLQSKRSKATSGALDGDFFHSHAVRGFKRRNVTVYDHAAFVRQFGGDEAVKGTTLKDGTWILDWMYRNAKIMF